MSCRLRNLRAVWLVLGCMVALGSTAVVARLAAAAATGSPSGAAPGSPSAAAPGPPSAAAASAVSSLDTLEQRAKPCMACHGLQGRATSEGFYPRIAGKPAGYLLNQLLNFRTGRRHFPMMVYFTALQDEAYLAELARYFADQHPPYPPPTPPLVGPEVLERGRTLVLRGDASLQVPACSACHGARLLGVQPAVPGLLGLSRDYLVAQLTAWRIGDRRARPPDCMAEIVHRLRPADVNAATAWLATQRVPADAVPDTAFVRPPPLRCGSLAPPIEAAARPSATAAPILERGRELVTLGGCYSCHTALGGAAFAGGRAIPTPFGTFYAPNITPDSRTGIGQWSADDFWRALHEGVSRDGRPLYPTFPYTNYTRIARADSDAMFAYLKSQPAASRANRAHEIRFPYDLRALLVGWRLLYFRPAVYRPDPAHSPAWNRGAYLVQGLGHCSACHRARNSLGAIRSGGEPIGGLVQSWYAPALSSSSEAGVQDWSADEVVELLSTGRLDSRHLDTGRDTGRLGGRSTARHEAAALGPMGEVVHDSLQYAAPADLDAMAAYLRSLPDARRTERALPPEVLGGVRALHEFGRRIYAEQCASCHGGEGEGRPPAGPPLAGNRAVTMPQAANPVRILLFGGYPPGTHGNPRPFGMPPFYPLLSDDQLADVLTYIRTSWGNSASPVFASEFAENRGSPLW